MNLTTHNEYTRSPPTCPVEDCTLPIDIVLQSSDGELFGAHAQNLEIYSEGFPRVCFVEVDSAFDIPVLEETGKILDLILRFMHNTHQPDLCKTPMNILSPLSEAVEKYMIYSAMEICKIYMTRLVKKHPVEVLLYSVKHDYPELANKSAPLTLSVAPAYVVARAQLARLHPSFVLKYLQYREINDSKCRSILRVNKLIYRCNIAHDTMPCNLWETFTTTVRLASIEKDFLRIEDIRNTMRRNTAIISRCQCCTISGRIWKMHVETAISQLPKFFDMYFM